MRSQTDRWVKLGLVGVGVLTLGGVSGSALASFTTSGTFDFYASRQHWHSLPDREYADASASIGDTGTDAPLFAAR